MVRDYRQEKPQRHLFLGFFSILLALYLCINAEANGGEVLEKIYSIKKLNKYTIITISQSGDYILVQGPSAEQIAETPKGVSFDPGGLKRLYAKQGLLIWEKIYPGFLEFCSNDAYLMEPSPDDVEGLYPPTIYYRMDGSLFFRMPEKRPEVTSFDVSPKSEMVLAGMWNGTVMLLHNGRKVWDYSTGLSGSVDVAFSKDGNYFVEDLDNTLFKIDKNGSINKINIPIVQKKLSSFKYRDLKNTIYFVLAVKAVNDYTPKIYQYIPQENKFFFLDLSHIAEVKRRFVLNELRKSYHIQAIKIEFSKFFDYVAVITDDNILHYFEIKEK